MHRKIPTILQLGWRLFKPITSSIRILTFFSTGCLRSSTNAWRHYCSTIQRCPFLICHAFFMSVLLSCFLQTLISSKIAGERVTNPSQPFLSRSSIGVGIIFEARFSLAEIVPSYVVTKIYPVRNSCGHKAQLCFARSN